MASAGQAAAQSLQAMHLKFKSIIPFFACCISSESVLSSEFWREGTLLIWIVDGPLRLKYVKERTKPNRVEPLRTYPLT
jgi:hypothetical protein